MEELGNNRVRVAEVSTCMRPGLMYVYRKILFASGLVVHYCLYIYYDGETLVCMEKNIKA